MMAETDPAHLVNELAKVEIVAEEILADRRQIIDLDKKRHKTREAVRALQRDKTSHKAWVCFGNMFIKLPKEKAVKLLEKDHSELDDELSSIRKNLKPKVNALRSMENKDDLKGFNLSPLSKDELSAVENIL